MGFTSVVAIILVCVGAIALIASFVLPKAESGYDEIQPRGIARLVGIVALLLGIVMSFFSMSYTQEAGEAKVLKDWTGTIVGTDTSEGLGWKAPWVETIDFDVKNQQAIYKQNGQPTSEGETVNGPEITFQDKDKVTGNADVAIRYSIDATSIEDIFRQYQSQENLTARLIDQDMRSVVRNTFSGYTTAQALEQRAQIEIKITESLAERWKGTGVLVEGVALQGVRYPEATTNGFTAAQESVTNLKKAEADLLVKEKESQQKVIQAEADAKATVVKAQADAKANELVSKSLTKELLAQQYNEALKEIGVNGGGVVVPEGSNPYVNIGGGSPKPVEDK